MKKIVVCCLLVVSLFTMSSCSLKEKQVCSTVYPVYFLIDRIGNPHIQACNISSEKTIQLAQPKSNYKSLLKNSDALIYIAGMEPYFDVYGSEIRDSDISYVDLGDKLYLYPFARLKNVGKDTTNIDEVATPYYEGSVFTGIDTYKSDPSFWLDPLTMLSAAEVVRDYLIYLYPEYEEDFNKNFKDLELDLTKLDADYQQIANSNYSLITMTSNFGYLQTTLGIQIYPIALSKYGAIPSDTELEIIKQRIKEDDVRYIVQEDNINEDMQKVYDELVNEFDLVPIHLSNLSTLSEPQRAHNKDYITIMYENLTELEGLGN